MIYPGLQWVSFVQHHYQFHSGSHIWNDCAGGHQGGHCVLHNQYCAPEETGKASEEDNCPQCVMVNGLAETMFADMK